jgi:glycosyltransferase involved in cell wall biosynthesis
MKLLVFTQKVSRDDSTLGFFHTWLIEMAKHAESLIVVCLEKGEHNLPSNVTVYSLGKERKISKLGYIKNFYSYLVLISSSYTHVFVHMNQEYLLLGGLYWKLKQVPVFFWRNHPKGNFLTYIAGAFSSKIFFTSPKSFTAQFKKAVRMPAGIDTNKFFPVDGVARKKYSVCMVGRVDPVKHVELALHTVRYLISKGTQISLTILGSSSKKNSKYYKELQEYVGKNELGVYVSFTPAVSPDKLPEIYSTHEICLNLTESGSFDKTIVEAAACGAVPLVSNTSLAEFLPTECVTEGSPESIGASIEALLEAHKRMEVVGKLEPFVKSQSLSVLIEKLMLEMK